VAIAPDGEATALFTHYEPPPPLSETEGLTAEFATHPAGGGWSPPVRLSPPQDGEALQLASAPDGDLMALWRTGTPPEFRRSVTSLEPVGATTWQKPERLSGRAANTTLALADGDKATAAWTGYNKKNGELLEVADYEPG
jgi:predicted neuraminidase